MGEAQRKTTEGGQAQRLFGLPEWRELLHAFERLYRTTPAAGSRPIRAHRQTVLRGIWRIYGENPPVRPAAAATQPATAHLRRALADAARERHAYVARAAEGVAPALAWRIGYADAPASLERRFAYAECAGPRGPIPAGDLILGFVLFGPGAFYPAHAHDGVAESYVCLAGAVAENDGGVATPGSLIFNPAGQAHSLTLPRRGPSLLAYAWTGAADVLAGQPTAWRNG